MKYFLIQTIVLFIFLIPTNSTAYKVDMHIWIGQQIINDLEDDGKLSFTIKGKTKYISLNQNILNAILSNKAYFLQGNVGPDALPGIYSGQMTIHPGGQNSDWGTGEWLEHMLKNATEPEEIAFTYGYFCHAASDVFAHTYVNLYSGDCFSLMDGETNVEERHVLLEGYISTFLPPMLDINGVNLGSPASNILIEGKPAVPTDFLWRIFLKNKSAINQFKNNDSPHFGLIYDLYNVLGEIAKDDGLAERLHNQIQKIVINMMLEIDLNEEELEKINKLRQNLRDFTNNTINEAQKIESNIKTEMINIFENQNSNINNHLKDSENIIKNIISLTNQKNNLKNKISGYKSQINELKDNIDDLKDRLDDLSPLKRLLSRKLKKKVKKRKKLIRRNKKNIEKAKQDLEKIINSEIPKNYAKLRNELDETLDTAVELLKKENELTQTFVDFLQRFETNENPIAGILIEWQNDIEKSMKNYFMANALAIYNSISSKEAIEPLEEWYTDWLPPILGVPSHLTHLKSTLDEIEELANNLDPVSSKIREIRTEIEDKIKSVTTTELSKFGEYIYCVDFKKFLELSSEKPNSAKLNSEFSKSPSSKKLLKINDISDRVNSEMHINNGAFNENDFNAVYNSIVLSKLSLLNHKEINTLVKKRLYSGKDLATDNVLIRLPKSIDGNHQWLKKAPPQIRTDENYNTTKSYGYDIGFLLWNDKKTRKRFFRKLFKGPLNPSLETPVEYDFEDILPNSYPYRPNKECQFPSYPESNKCN
ncbi:zinc dependent phospholipase C family protein [Mangrovimonas sp. DI 80]|uniref:zinc dependent phospholipase C family protein n=1 Tax=Mangrovimonas sp. DI 80 TaxID=1779330 RepID=UPI000975F67D|nr:zinc dependent phospholipase C family protein [Mangrovimonas sp. DI 80]OMP30067.1 hypothetical protein BKM32_14410 [Mangrovimonas sp. DI 80]